MPVQLLLHEIAIVKPECTEDMLHKMGGWMPDNEVVLDNAQAEANDPQDPPAAIVYITIQTLISVICVVLSCTIIITCVYIYIYIPLFII
jgi:hypothetical protein